MAQKITLAQARIRRFMSATKLAELAGVATSTVRAIERGRVKTVRLDTIERLSKVLEMDPTEIEWPGNPLGALEDDEHN